LLRLIRELQRDVRVGFESRLDALVHTVLFYRKEGKN